MRGTILLCICSLCSLGSAFLLSRDVCYEDLGCFETGEFRSLQRPVVLLPDTPQAINTTFWLYTRGKDGSSSTIEQQLSYYNRDTITSSYYDPKQETKLIIHGYTHDSRQAWVQRLIDALLNSNKNLNVIAVNWKNGARFPYTQATGNSLLVGAQIDKLIRVLIAVTGRIQSQSDFHLLGHGLGAHVAGFAGSKTMGEIGRISGLDPTSLYFEGAPEKVRLDASDAKFVDVVHTDASSLLTNLGTGILQPSGHVDFYPNGGANQPGCSQKMASKVINALAFGISGGYDGAEQVIVCSTIASVAYYIESIMTACPFTGYQCSDYNSFATGRCLDCGPDGSGCARFGYNVPVTARGSFYMKTQSDSPFCSYHYSITGVAGQLSKNAYGSIKVEVKGDGGSTGPLDLTDLKGLASGVISSGESLATLAAVGKSIGQPSIIITSYQKASCTLTCILYANDVKLQKVTLKSGEEDKKTTFCLSDSPIGNNIFKTAGPSATEYC